MSVGVNSLVRDFLGFGAMLAERTLRIRFAGNQRKGQSPINALARKAHPAELHLVIKEIRQETPSTRTFRLVPDGSDSRELPYFRAGQYIALRTAVGGTLVSRPYSIASSPAEARVGGYFDITIRKRDGGFVTEHIFANWQEGTHVRSCGPMGCFYHEPLRDARHLVCLAGGSGITPFRSLLRDIVDRDLDLRATLLYGVRDAGDIIYRDELTELAKTSRGRIRVVFVCSEPGSEPNGWSGPRGFLSAALIRAEVSDLADSSFFICGPRAMYQFLERELRDLEIPRRRIRREVFGEPTDITSAPGYPAGATAGEWKIAIELAGERMTIVARADESILVALERAGLEPAAACRSGECAVCRAHLLKGDVFVAPWCDGRRTADTQHGYIHTCSTYPLSDLSLRVPPPPVIS